MAGRWSASPHHPYSMTKGLTRALFTFCCPGHTRDLRWFKLLQLQIAVSMDQLSEQSSMGQNEPWILDVPSMETQPLSNSWLGILPILQCCQSQAVGSYSLSEHWDWDGGAEFTGLA